MRIIANTGTEARHPWPEEVSVQGGSGGVVFSEQGNYRTAFVEAFPGGTFLRGEGPTLAEAEDSCWEQYQRYTGCEHGPFERRQYRNGAGFCTKCGIWMSRVFEPLPKDPDHRPNLAERLFADRDPDALAEVLHTLAHADELPTQHEVRDER